MQNIETPSKSLRKIPQGSLQPNAPATTRDYFDLISQEDTARILGKSINTLRRWGVERTGPPRVKIGRDVFYRITLLMKWIDEQSSPAFDSLPITDDDDEEEQKCEAIKKKGEKASKWMLVEPQWNHKRIQGRNNRVERAQTNLNIIH